MNHHMQDMLKAHPFKSNMKMDMDMLISDKSTSVDISLKRPPYRHSRESGNPEVVVIANTGFLPSQE